MAYSSPLEALRRGDEPRFGGKSASLGELFAAGVPVPPGFALSTRALADFIRWGGLQEAIDGRVSRVSPDDIDGVGAAASAVAESMRSAPLPQEIVEEVAASYERLCAEDPSAPVAVRSSAVGEDSQDATFAGQQETYLWVRGSGAICAAVRDCWVSLYGARAISYRARLGDRPARPQMGVAVQLMVDAAVAGVMFTCNPVSGDPSTLAISASWGLGLGVVSGEVTPDELHVSKVTGELVSEQIHDKAVEYLPDPDGRGAVRREVPPERRHSRCLDANAVAELASIARRVERHFGSPQDIEWVLGRDRSVFVVQSRPVTGVRRPKRELPEGDALSLVMRTFGAR